MTTTSVVLEAGTYSHATLRDEDMLDMFDTIATLTKCDWCVGEVQRAQAIESCVSQRCVDSGINCRTCTRNQEDVSEAIAYLFDHVDESHAPAGHYFGSIEGDASDFGIWAVDDEVTA